MIGRLPKGPLEGCHGVIESAQMRQGNAEAVPCCRKIRTQSQGLPQHGLGLGVSPESVQGAALLLQHDLMRHRLRRPRHHGHRPCVARRFQNEGSLQRIPPIVLVRITDGDRGFAPCLHGLGARRGTRLGDARFKIRDPLRMPILQSKGGTAETVPHFLHQPEFMPWSEPKAREALRQRWPRTLQRQSEPGNQRIGKPPGHFPVSPRCQMHMLVKKGGSRRTTVRRIDFCLQIKQRHAFEARKRSGQRRLHRAIAAEAQGVEIPRLPQGGDRILPARGLRPLPRLLRRIARKGRAIPQVDRRRRNHHRPAAVRQFPCHSPGIGSKGSPHCRKARRVRSHFMLQKHFHALP